MKKIIPFLFLFSFLFGCDDTNDTNNDAGTNNDNNIVNNNNDNNNNTNNTNPPDFMLHPAKVREIIDGDTILVLFNGVEQKVRFKGINCPETHGTVEPFGPEATTFTSNHVTVNGWVGLEFDDDRCAQADPPDNLDCLDVYDRILAYIRTDQDQDLNAQLLVNGLAEVYNSATFNRKTLYLQLQDQAQEAGVGIWSLK